MMKVCSHCKIPKSVAEFSWKIKAKNLLARECKSCHKKMRHSHYQKNIKKEKTRIINRRLEIREWYQKLKATLFCHHCRENSPCCLQFHHKNPKYKSFDIAYAVNNGAGIKTLKKEIKKCIILCANCHLKHHANSA